MPDFERLGVFYLGKEYDLAAGRASENLILYDSKDLCTHAVCVGMTGSGKTGLGLALLEEAAIDGLPALIIDPKGDLGNLLLAFPQLRGEDFAPWVEPAEAARAGVSTQQYAGQIAERWKNGLAEWGQDGARIQRFMSSAETAIYTPGSSAGLPLTVLRSFDAPPESTLTDAEALRDRVNAAASGLLGLLGIDADPLKSREHILLASVFDRSWRAGQNLDMASLIRAIQTPPFDKLGVMDLESTFPAKDRFELAMRLNNLLASPGFAAWMEGEPLDIQQLLYTPAGKPRLAILSIAHLSDAERMFFVTLLLSEVIAWMRAQSGTSSLRAILYMDEVFGYFPPSANPPSKTPMLTLLKQARAYGLGVVLATQNPVDLDYKGLANCGTWFLGRLQTERDKLRVLDGLEGASTAAGAAFDRAEMERILSGLGNRVFLMNNVHEDHPVAFQTRWALSYLRGPLTREQIGRLMAPRKSATQARSASEGNLPATSIGLGAETAASSDRPVLPPDVPERFIARRANLPPGASVLYRPALLGTARVHFVQAATGIDTSQQVTLLVPLEDGLPADAWSGAAEPPEPPETEAQPEAGSKFSPLSSELSRPKKYGELATSLKDYLYRNRRLSVLKCPALKEVSSPDETEAAFRIRLAQKAREQRDLEVEELRKKYASKIAAAEDRVRRAENKIAKEKSQKSQQWLSSMLSVGSTIVGALLGRKMLSTTTMTRAATSARQIGRATQEDRDIAEAEESLEVARQKLQDLSSQCEAEINHIQTSFSPDALALDEVQIAPKKTDIAVGEVALAWQPWIVRMDGAVEPGS